MAQYDNKYLDGTGLTRVIAWINSRFATKSEIPDVPEQEEHPVKDVQNSNGTSLVDPVTKVATIPVIPTVPTNVSAFNNDAGYITQSDIVNGDILQY